jgi:hypothetical protein
VTRARDRGLSTGPRSRMRPRKKYLSKSCTMPPQLRPLQQLGAEGSTEHLAMSYEGCQKTRDRESPDGDHSSPARGQQAPVLSRCKKGTPKRTRAATHELKPDWKSCTSCARRVHRRVHQSQVMISLPTVRAPLMENKQKIQKKI